MFLLIKIYNQILLRVQLFALFPECIKLYNLLLNAHDKELTSNHHQVDVLGLCMPKHAPGKVAMKMERNQLKFS